MFLIPLLIVLVLGGPMEGFANEPERIKIFNALTGRVEEREKVYKTDAEWKKILTPEQYNVTRTQGTEKPFSGSLCSIPKKGKRGLFKCVACGTDLFLVEKEFDSGTGWPSFLEPVSELNITTRADDRFGMRRIEVLCARCSAHLGHVFDDGPPPTGKRYCINSVALKFVEIEKPKKEKLEKAVFGAGCFWGVEAAFAQVKGVIRTKVGFAGGNLKNPSYKDVSTGKTGHAEVVELEYDPNVISYNKLLDLFWNIHDPTTLNRQGPDAGTQYRSVIFYQTPEQGELARLSKKRIEESGKFEAPVVTQIIPGKEFYQAEDYHQRYYEKRGLKPTCHIPNA